MSGRIEDKIKFLKPDEIDFISTSLLKRKISYLTTFVKDDCYDSGKWRGGALRSDTSAAKAARKIMVKAKAGVKTRGGNDLLCQAGVMNVWHPVIVKEDVLFMISRYSSQDVDRSYKYWICQMIWMHNRCYS